MARRMRNRNSKKYGAKIPAAKRQLPPGTVVLKSFKYKNRKRG